MRVYRADGPFSRGNQEKIRECTEFRPGMRRMHAKVHCQYENRLPGMGQGLQAAEVTSDDFPFIARAIYNHRPGGLQAIFIHPGRVLCLMELLLADYPISPKI